MISRNLTSQAWVDHIQSRIDDTRTYQVMVMNDGIDDGYEGVQDPEHYGAKEALTEDHGTCQHSFLSPDGDAVSVTASINLIWGCKFMSPSTGIIMNNQVIIYLTLNVT